CVSFFYQAEDRIRDPLVTGVQTCALPISPAWAVTVDRVAARIDQQVLTVSEINQMVQIRFFPNNDPQQILEALIAQALRFRDVRSEERRVGKGVRHWGTPDDYNDEE